MNIEAFEQLKRVLADIPANDFDLTNWHNCACGHATQDAWFLARGFSSCNDFGRAAAFFQISRGQAAELFSDRAQQPVTPGQMIERIDDFLAQPPAAEQRTADERRQAIIDGLLIRANKAAKAARRVASTLISALF
jgi:hypothetical protein